MSKTRSIGSLVVLVLVLPGALPSAPTPLTACGAPGKAPCPLQALMREQLARPYALRDFEELAAGAAALPALNPNASEWRDWDRFARDATEAAVAHDEASALRACTHCHHTYRHEYLEKYRERALPSGANGSR